MLAFDLAEKNKMNACMQYIKLLGLKNPEDIVKDGEFYTHTNSRGKSRTLLPCLTFSEYQKREKEFVKTKMKKCIGYYVIEIESQVLKASGC